MTRPARWFTVVAGRRRWAKGYRLSPRRPGRAVVTLMLTVVATIVLCVTQAPMWLQRGAVHRRWVRLLPVRDPAALNRAAGPSNVRFRHLTGPWWTYARDGF